MNLKNKQLMQNRPIGVFDSGVGGLSVLRELKKILPHENFIYFGDSKNIPYGEKTVDQLVSFSRNILNYFSSRDVKMVLMACNTSSSVTLDIVNDEYDFEVLGLIEPTAKYISSLKEQNIGIIATSATINSNAYKSKILKYSSKNVYQMPCPNLVELVENELTHTLEADKLVAHYLQPLCAQNIEKLVLGCTHYPFLHDAILKVLKKEDMLINPAEYLAHTTFSYLEKKQLLNSNGGEVEFYCSKSPTDFAQVGAKLFGATFDCQLLELN